MLRRLQFHRDSIMNDTLYVSNVAVATSQHCVYYGSLLKALQLIALTHLQILRPEGNHSHRSFLKDANWD